MTASHPARWHRRKEARPQEIQAAALACFARHGFAATRLEDVAARAGVSKGTLYLYVSSKEELFKEVVRGALLPVLRMLESELVGSGSARESLARLFAVWRRQILDSPLGALHKVMLAEAGNFPQLARFYLDEVVSRGRTLVAGLLRRGIDDGEFRPVDVEHATISLIGPLLFHVLWKHSLGLVDSQPFDGETLCRSHLELMLRGLAAEPADAGSCRRLCLRVDPSEESKVAAPHVASPGRVDHVSG